MRISYDNDVVITNPDKKLNDLTKHIEKLLKEHEPKISD